MKSAPAAEAVWSPEAAAERRKDLTKVYYGMLYQNAPAQISDPVAEELATLGGVDPGIEPFDGPDNQGEWARQAEADARGCEAGLRAACDRLQESETKARG